MRSYLYFEQGKKFLKPNFQGKQMKKQSNKTTSWIDGILKMYFLMVIFTGFFSISEQGIHIFKFFCIAFNFFNSLFQPFERKKKLRFDVMKR